MSHPAIPNLVKISLVLGKEETIEKEKGRTRTI